MKRARRSSRRFAAHAAATALALAGCIIGPNPEFMPPAGTSSGSTSFDATSGADAGTSAAPADSTGADSTTGTTLGAGEATGATTLDTSSSSSGDGSTSFDPCWEYFEYHDPAPLGLMFVVDKSAPMAKPWDHDRDDLDDDGLADLDPNLPATPKIPRWASVHAAVAQIAERFALVHAGLSLYPAKTATMAYGPPACPVAVPIDAALDTFNAAAIVAAMPPADAVLLGARPAATSIDAAVAALQDPGAPARKKILFITGGAANCDADAADDTALLEFYDDSVNMAIAQAYFDGILTHVVGVAIDEVVSPKLVDGLPDGVDDFKTLNTLAELGGTAKAGGAKFLAADDEAALVAALDASVRAGLSCTVTLDEVPPYPFGALVKVAGQQIQTVTDCAGDSGWRYAVEGLYDQVELCGDACARFQEHGDLSFEHYCQAG